MHSVLLGSFLFLFLPACRTAVVRLNITLIVTALSYLLSLTFLLALTYYLLLSATLLLFSTFHSFPHLLSFSSLHSLHLYFPSLHLSFPSLPPILLFLPSTNKNYTHE